MKNQLSYEEISLCHLTKLAESYVETFNSQPWNDQWTLDTAAKRLRQMVSTEDSYGICAYQDGELCAAAIGCMEQFYDGVLFNLREFWVRNGKRGQGIGTQVCGELERRLIGKGVARMILFTAKGDDTEHFYHKQHFQSNPDMVFMEKTLSSLPAGAN